MTKRIKYNINNARELRAMIASLKAQRTLQTEALLADSKTYLKQYTLGNLVKKYLTPSFLLKADEKLNLSSSILSKVLPLVINNTLFRGSGIITKAIVGLASGRMARNLDAEHISNAVHTVKSWFSKSEKKKKPDPAYLDYGIPPDSETY